MTAKLVPISKRRQIAAGLLIAAGTAIILALWLASVLHSPRIGWDFPVFYIAAKIPVNQLYDRAAFEAVWKRDLVPLGVPHWAAYVRPAAFAVLLKPLAFIPYSQALWLWMGVAVTAYFAAVALLVHHFRLPVFLFPASAAFFPAIGGILSGQDAAIYLLALVIAVQLLQRRLDVAAGLVLLVCLCKFNLIMLVPVALLAHRRFRALLTFAAGAFCTAAFSLFLAPLSAYTDAIKQTQLLTPGFYPVGLRGFSNAIGHPSIYPFLAACAGGICCWLMTRLTLTESLCVAIVGALLLSPYITWYDSTLLVLPLAAVFGRGFAAMNWLPLAILAAAPVWEHGGGNNGPKGYMHVGVEAFLLCFLASKTKATVSKRTGTGTVRRAKINKVGQSGQEFYP